VWVGSAGIELFALQDAPGSTYEVINFWS